MNKLGFKAIAFITGVTLITSGCQIGSLGKQPSPTPTAEKARLLQFQDRQRVQVVIGQQTATVEIVNSPTSIVQGLSGRDEIGSDGMLFMLPETGTPTFWMKDMKFDLDMIWLKDGEVVDITFNVPHPTPGTPEAALPLISPKYPANMVLEVPAGTTEAWGLQIGDRLRFN